MAEAERRPGKTPLLKQPEIEEVDEEHRPADEPPYANNKDSAHHIHNNSSRNSEDGDANPTDHGECEGWGGLYFVRCLWCCGPRET